MIRKIFFFALIVCSTSLYSQIDYQFDHLGQINEMANTSVTAITQDDKGFIWFGTTNGLIRYDGFKVKLFKHDPQNKNSLSDNNIRALASDGKGNLWIATQGGGLNQLILAENRFIHFKHNPDNKQSISGNAIWSVLVDKSGLVWAVSGPMASIELTLEQDR